MRFFDFEYGHDGKNYVLRIDGDLQWPVLIIDRLHKRVEVTCDWPDWIETGRFLTGFKSHMFILDGVGCPYTLRVMSGDGRGVPVLSTELLAIDISCDELIEVYRASCLASRATCGDFTHIITLKEFVTQVLNDHGMTV